MKPTTNNQTLCLPAPRTRAQRIAEAKARHATSTPDIIILHETLDADRDAREILTAASRDAYTALAARYRASGQKLMDDLRRNIPHDLRRAGIELKATAADEERATAAGLRKDAQRAKSKAKAKKNTEEERAALEALATSYRAQADNHSGHAHDIDQTTSHDAHTDTADIIQAAALARWESIRTTTAADHRAAINAAGKSINDLAAAKGYTATRTKVKPITQADLDTLRAKWPMYVINDQTRPNLKIDRLPFSTTGRATGYYSVEYRNTAKYPSGLYMIAHYATTAPISLDDFAKGAKDDEGSTYAETLRELAHIDRTAAEADHQPQLTALLEAAAPLLTERDRTILTWATDDTNAASVAAGIRAVEMYMQKTDQRASEASNPKTAKAIRRHAAKRAEIIRQQARIRAAMNAAGVPANDVARRKVKSRIKARLEAAMIAAPYWHMMNEAPTAARVIETKRADLLKWTDRPAAEDARESCIRWTRRPFYMGEAVTTSTAAQREQEIIDRRKAEQDAHEAAQAAKAAHIAAIAEATARAADYFIKPARASAAVFEAEGRAERAARFEAMCERMEASQAARQAAQEAAEAQAADLDSRRREAYNKAVRAAYAAMGTTYAKATADQRAKATAAAQAARDSITK